MDWNSRIPCWDFGEDQFEQGTIPGNSVTATVFGKSSSSGSRRSQAEAAGGMTDLKLGQLIEDLKVPNVSKMTLSPSGSSKRARALSIQAAAAAACLVDGCVADLTNCREYHRRHKVCELHSKSPQVTINGHKQRFCQQCSRFHSLEEFDEGKRSCRKRLDGHNRRRRKPQPESLSRVGSIFSSQQSLDDRFNGSTMLQFSNPHAYQTTAVANPIWGGIVKAEEDAMYYNKYSHLPEKQNPHLFPESSSSSNRGSSGKQQQFSLFHSSTSLKLNNHTLSQKGLSFASSETSSSNEKLFCDGYPGPGPARVVHSDCALSLLSSSPSQTSCMSLGHTMHHPNSFSTANPLDQSVLDYSISEPMMVHNGGGSSSVADVHCQGMVHMGLRDNETPQTLPFYWE